MPSEAVVAVCAERSPELIAALLGIVKAGGAYAPLDPAHPPERLAFAPDCGLSQTARWAARQKLANMVAGARLVRQRHIGRPARRQR